MLVGVLSVVAAIYGYDLIHAYARVMTYVSGAVLAADRRVDHLGARPAGGFPERAMASAHSGLLGTISAAALWQIAYAPYVSDYSRYMPRDTGVRAGVLGELLGLHARLAAAHGAGRDGRPGGAARAIWSRDSRALTRGIAPLVLIVFSVGVATANAMNLYCGALSTLTFGQTLFPRWSAAGRSPAPSCVLVLFGAVAGRQRCSARTHSSTTTPISSCCCCTCWCPGPRSIWSTTTCCVTASTMWPRSSASDGGIYGRVNAAAVGCYMLGILVQLPFVANSAVSPARVARAMGGIDLSWIVGLAVTSPVYYWLASRSRARSDARVAAQQLQA